MLSFTALGYSPQLLPGFITRYSVICLVHVLIHWRDRGLEAVHRRLGDLWGNDEVWGGGGGHLSQERDLCLNYTLMCVL